MAITGGSKTRAILTRYPVTSGLTAETTRTYNRQINLKARRGSKVRKDMRIGME